MRGDYVAAVKAYWTSAPPAAKLGTSSSPDGGPARASSGGGLTRVAGSLSAARAAGRGAIRELSRPACGQHHAHDVDDPLGLRLISDRQGRPQLGGRDLDDDVQVRLERLCLLGRVCFGDDLE